MDLTLTEEQRRTFDADGFVSLGKVLTDAEIEAARGRFEPLFRGDFDTGLLPDEWNWRHGVSDPALTRQICNGWKSDRTIARIVLDPAIGEALATLKGWPGARINQDNVLWKPPGARALGFHQDDSYQNWIEPAEMMTCWITLDATSVEGGTVEYVRGSHRWPLAPPIEQFHAPDNPLADMQRAAELAGVEAPEIVPIVTPAGGAVLHHGRTWHGSRDNRGTDHRRAVVSHCMSSDARFHPTEVSPIYSRYRRGTETEMDEAFFPVLWRKDGYRSPGLDPA